MEDINFKRELDDFGKAMHEMTNGGKYKPVKVKKDKKPKSKEKIIRRISKFISNGYIGEMVGMNPKN